MIDWYPIADTTVNDSTQTSKGRNVPKRMRLKLLTFGIAADIDNEIIISLFLLYDLRRVVASCIVLL
jgi:hypothetical protein